MTRHSVRAPTYCCRSGRRRGRISSSGPCLRSNCSARPQSLRTTLIIGKGSRMRRFALSVIALPLLVAASAPVPPLATPFNADIRRARAEQAAASAETAKLEKAAGQARDEATRLRAQQTAAGQAINAAEARITASDAELRLSSAYVAQHRYMLRREQRPIASLLAGLATMAERPPLLTLADRGGMDELVKVRILLDATLPAIRTRPAALSSHLARSRQLERTAFAVRNEPAASH